MIQILTKNEIIRPKYLPKRSRTHRIHSARLKVDKNCTRNILATGRLIVVNVNTFQLQVGIATVRPSWIYSVFIRYDLPELHERGKVRNSHINNLCSTGPTSYLGANLVAALAGLKVNYLTHHEE